MKTAIRYRYGYITGLGASLIDGFMEDLATDRIYRLMIAQRIQHGMHTREEVTAMFDDELAKLLEIVPAEQHADYREARRETEQMIETGQHDPI